MLNCGCCISPEYYDLIAELGYDYIEFPGSVIYRLSDADFDKLVKKVRSGCIPVYGFVSLLTSDVAICGPNFDPDKVLAYAGLICKRGAALGIRVIGVGSPASRRLPEGFETDLAWKQCETFIRIFCEEAAKYPGLIVMYEALNHTIADFGLSMREGADFVRRMNISNLSLICDTGHMDVENEGVEDIAYCMPDISHTHLAEVAGTERRYLSEGQYGHYKTLIGALIKNGYKGNFSVEAFAGDIPSGARTSIGILRRILAGCK